MNKKNVQKVKTKKGCKKKISLLLIMLMKESSEIFYIMKKMMHS